MVTVARNNLINDYYGLVIKGWKHNILHSIFIGEWMPYTDIILINKTRFISETAAYPCDIYQ